MIAISVIGATATGVVVLWRRKLLALPLELAPVACRSLYGGHPVFRFRVRLGRNRILTQGQASVRFCGDGGEVELPLELASVKACVGPWTLAVLDRNRQCSGGGEFVVSVQAQEGERTWEVCETYATAAMQTGRFASAATVTSTALTLDADVWDAVVVEDTN
ncbi:MAG: hypothetical protein ACJATT_005881 [Myxococcota bacterium]